MGRAYRFGRRGEAVAARFLEARGWPILARNWRSGPRELDLVAERDGLVAFVEVKARTGPGFGDPLEAITPRKRAEVERAARAWIRTFPQGRGTTFRFDAIAVEFEGPGAPRVRHLPDAWRIGDG